VISLFFSQGSATSDLSENDRVLMSVAWRESRSDRWAILQSTIAVLIINGNTLRSPGTSTSHRAGSRKPTRHWTNHVEIGKKIRLTSRDIERLTRLTRFNPEGVKSVDDLDAYVERCKQYYWGKSLDSRRFHRLIDDTVAEFRQTC
jgi:hypothetical protein